MEKVYTLAEASEILNVKLRTLRDWVYKGKLGAIRYEGSRLTYISAKEIRRIQKNMEKVRWTN